MKKKKIIGIILAAVLVAAGLGTFAYANPEPVNKVSAMFSTQWNYDVPGDAFFNGEVEGREDFFAQMQNDPDDTGADVIGLTLTLATETEFNFFQEENLVSEEYPPYEWDFDNVPEGLGPVAWVGFMGVPQPLVSLTPGFDASRLLSETEFLQSEGTQIQTLTITLTPQADEVMTEGGWFSIGVGAEENELVNAVITSPTGGDGHRLNIPPTGLELDKEWTIDVTIEVTPKVPKVEFMPFVDIKWFGPPSPSGTESGSSLSYTAPEPEVGTWTWNAEPWSAEGSYEWQWTYNMARGLRWHPCSREIIIQHEPMTGQKLVGTGGWYQFPPQADGTYIEGAGSFTLLNPDCVSEITIDRIFFFSLYGEVIYDSVEDGWPDEDQPWIEPVKPHEIRWIEVDSLMWRLGRKPADVVFTIEVFWTGAKEGLPLTGWANTSIVRRNTEGGILGFESMAETQMVNMEQVLTPEKPKEEK